MEPTAFELAHPAALAERLAREAQAQQETQPPVEPQPITAPQ